MAALPPVGPFSRSDTAAGPPASTGSSSAGGDIPQLEQAVTNSSRIRAVKLGPLVGDTRAKIGAFLDVFDNQIAPLYEQLLSETREEHRAPIIERINALKKPLMGDHQSLDGVYDDIDSALAESLDPKNRSNVRFLLERCRNVFVNRIIYDAEFRDFVERNKARIIQEFAPPEHQRQDPSLFTITYNLKNQHETHNGGKSPVAAHFKMRGGPSFSVFYKPRSASVDTIVLDTFAAINQLPLPDRSSDDPLPFYKILNFPEESKSIWAHINGENIFEITGKHMSAKVFIESSFLRKRTDAERRSLEKRLNRMDAIVGRMHISDQHGENIVIENLSNSSQEVRLIPVDLENRQEAWTSTQLGGDPSQVQLTPKEQEVIDRNIKLLEREVCRYVPIGGTTLLSRMVVNYKSIDRLLPVLIQNITQAGFELQVSPAVLTSLILSDIINRDVPYFSQQGDNVFLGKPEDGNFVARRRKEEE